MKFGGIVPEVNTHYWRSRFISYDVNTFKMVTGYDVISRRKVLPSGECTHSVRQFL